MARKVGQASKKNGKSGFRDPELPIKKKPFDNGKKSDLQPQKRMGKAGSEKRNCR